MEKAIRINTHHAYLNTDIVLSSSVSNVNIEDKQTGQTWLIVDKITIRLSAGHHVLVCPELNEEIHVVIEDAVKFGGSSLKKGYVFDDNSWVFVVMKDRTYIANIDTNEEKVEYNITPDEILSLGIFNGMSNNFFLFRTAQDFSLYNVQLGKITKTFTNHIYSNPYYIVYQDGEKIVVYDYHKNCVLVEFDGQYSFGSKLYFIKNNKLFGIDKTSTRINEIEYVEEISKGAILYNNSLLKINGDYNTLKDSFYKKYTFYELGNGEEGMTKTNFLFPFFIGNWFGADTDEFLNVKEERDNYIKKNKDHLPSNVSHASYGFKFDFFEIIEFNNRKELIFKGEIIRYPDFYGIKPKFSFKTKAGEAVTIRNISFHPIQENVKESVNSKAEDKQRIPEGERLVASSVSKQRIVTMKDSCFYYHDFRKSYHCTLFEKTFDKSSYSNAFFTSDGKHVVFQSIDGSFDILGFEDLSLDKFEIDGSTVSRTSGFNGYKPIIEIVESDCRIPVWRDAITLQRIDRDEMSDRLFMSPDRLYSASTTMLKVYYNILTGKEITPKEYEELCSKYNWYEFAKTEDNEKDKEEKRVIRKNFMESIPKEKLVERIMEKYKGLDDSPTNGIETKEQRRKRIIDMELRDYTENNCCFTELFIDILGYVCYKNNKKGKENRVLIGRSAWFLNYVSFSYDSKFLAFGAKMKEDAFRHSEEGVFVLFDLNKEIEVVRKDEKDNLYAVWMTMFSKDGSVAYYDSRANAYVSINSNYEDFKIIGGKSLLCFSPSGKYIAFSDQNYIDYTHHPNIAWGHQPSGNIFIHSMDDVQTCKLHFHDFGNGIVGVSSRAGNVASAAFSSDDRRLMAVGDDGVIVIRNLNLVDDTRNVLINNQNCLPYFVGKMEE